MKIHELEAIIIDLQDNLKEKDSVIDSKMKAVTLMSEDLSKRGKTTLDTLEDTKDEMRAMQANFVMMESSFKEKHEHLLGQLEMKTIRVMELEEEMQKEEMKSDGTEGSKAMVEDMRTEMKRMQENFVLVEASLKEKVKSLMDQLEDRERRLEGLEDMSKEERVDKEEEMRSDDTDGSNAILEDMRTEMKTMQENFILIESSLKDKVKSLIDQLEERERRLEGLDISKDERIERIEESNRELREENQKLLMTLENLKIQSELDKVKDERIQELEMRVEEKESETEKVLRKELEDLNKNMIKLKAQHKSKMRNLNNRLEKFKMVGFFVIRGMRRCT